MQATDQELNAVLATVLRASSDQVRTINDALKRRYAAIDHEKASQIHVGMRVTWVGKRGPQAGVVKKIKQRYVEVAADKRPGELVQMNWNVSAGMLTPEAKP